MDLFVMAACAGAGLLYMARTSRRHQSSEAGDPVQSIHERCSHMCGTSNCDASSSAAGGRPGIEAAQRLRVSSTYSGADEEDADGAIRHASQLSIDNIRRHERRRRRRLGSMAGYLLAATVGARLAAHLATAALTRRSSGRLPKSQMAKARSLATGESADRRDAKGRERLSRIPLTEVVRFKERQWFLEELEASKGGDANAMLRLAKQYLHGQGCEKSITAAQDWLRKARQLGIYSTLDELYAGDDLRREYAEQTQQDARRKAAAATRAGGTSGAAAVAQVSRHMRH